MKFTIRKEVPKNQGREIEFWIKTDGKIVSLFVCQKGSHAEYCVLNISQEGLDRIRYVSKDLGFKTDDDGRIVLVHEV